jgi:hypothetical protein
MGRPVRRSIAATGSVPNQQHQNRLWSLAPSEQRRDPQT